MVVMDGGGDNPLRGSKSMHRRDGRSGGGQPDNRLLRYSPVRYEILPRRLISALNYTVGHEDKSFMDENLGEKSPSSS